MLWRLDFRLHRPDGDLGCMLIGAWTLACTRRTPHFRCQCRMWDWLLFLRVSASALGNEDCGSWIWSGDLAGWIGLFDGVGESCCYCCGIDVALKVSEASRLGLDLLVILWRVGRCLNVNIVQRFPGGKWKERRIGRPMVYAGLWPWWCQRRGSFMVDPDQGKCCPQLVDATSMQVNNVYAIVV